MTDHYAENRSKIYSCLADMFGREPQPGSLWMFESGGPLQEMAAVLEAPLTIPEGLAELRQEFRGLVENQRGMITRLGHLLGRLARLSSLEAKAWARGEIRLVVDCLMREREVLRGEVREILEYLRREGPEEQENGFFGYLIDLTIEYLSMEDAEIDLWLLESSLAVEESVSV